jgi:hypothetical protein
MELDEPGLVSHRPSACEQSGLLFQTDGLRAFGNFTSGALKRDIKRYCTGPLCTKAFQRGSN